MYRQIHVCMNMNVQGKFWKDTTNLSGITPEEGSAIRQERSLKVLLSLLLYFLLNIFTYLTARIYYRSCVYFQTESCLAQQQNIGEKDRTESLGMVLGSAHTPSDASKLPLISKGMALTTTTTTKQCFNFLFKTKVSVLMLPFIFLEGSDQFACE